MFDVAWHYPRRSNPVPPVQMPGTDLDDIVSPAMPFTDIFQHSTLTGVTNRAMLMHVPDYTYERMQTHTLHPCSKASS